MRDEQWGISRKCAEFFSIHALSIEVWSSCITHAWTSRVLCPLSWVFLIHYLLCPAWEESNFKDYLFTVSVGTTSLVLSCVLPFY